MYRHPERQFIEKVRGVIRKYHEKHDHRKKPKNRSKRPNLTKMGLVNYG